MTAFELYTRLGFEHILDRRLLTDTLAAEGYDHLLFIVALAVIYQLKDIKKVVVLVTAFTIGHSLTLLISTWYRLPFSSTLIEALIPLTILLTGLYNIIFHQSVMKKKSLRLRYLAALVFGLIHGLGFSNYLKSLLGQEESIITPLLGFNVGIELAQLLIVAVVLFLFFTLNKLFKVKQRTWILLVSSIVVFMTAPIFWSSLKALFN